MDDDRHAWARILVGKPLGHRYKLDGLLGVGGMGAVYAATNLAVGRRVAIKLLAPGLLRNPTAIERFQQEARLAATVGGTGVVEMLDFEVDPAMGAFLVMEHLYGESVDARIARLGQIDVGETLWIGTHLLETLAAIHRHGVIHRDLKPANVFLAVTVEGNEVVKVLDFGLSRILEDLDPTRLTGRGATLGTPAYMAPEQAKGGRLDHRTDLYGAAAVLYACLTGRPPRDSWLVLDDVPAPVHAFRSDVPRALSDVIARAMSSDPLARHDDADALAAALRTVVEPSSWDTMQRRRGGSYATQQTDLRAPVEPGARANPLDGSGGAGAAAPTTPPVLSSLGSSPAASSHHPSSTVATSSAAVPVVSSAAVPVVSPSTGAIPQPLPPTGAIPQPLPPTGAIPQPLPPTGAIGQPAAAAMPAAVVAAQAPTSRSVRWLIVALVAALVAAVAATGVAVVVVLRSPAGAASTIPATDPGAPAPAAVVAAVATTPLSTEMMTRVQQG
ncbi:MAG: protein kinase, partial [Deltaproteobacteria bacterium]|nr:protein kinase [Deltaproteobacteria bacterium]